MNFKCVEIEGFCVDCAKEFMDMDSCSGVFLSGYWVFGYGDGHVLPEGGVDGYDNCDGSVAIRKKLILQSLQSLGRKPGTAPYTTTLDPPLFRSVCSTGQINTAIVSRTSLCKSSDCEVSRGFPDKGLGSGLGLADWWWICRFVYDWHRILGLVMDWQIGDGLTDWSNVGIILLDWWWIGRLVQNWRRIDGLVMDWQICHGLDLSRIIRLALYWQIGIILVCWWWIGGLVQDWLLIDGLVLDWKWLRIVGLVWNCGKVATETSSVETLLSVQPLN